MTSRQQLNPTGEHRGLLAVAIIALFMALLALFWGIRTLYRLGALGAPRGSAAVTVVLTRTPQPSATSMPTDAASATSTPLTGAPLPTLEPIRLPTEAQTETPSPAEVPSPTPTAADLEGAYAVEYLGCIKHGSGTGTVKGQVFDRQGGIVVGAEVRVTLNDWTYDRPGITNRDGWYEFYLDKGLKVRIASLRIGGREIPLLGNDGLVVESQGGCYENINFRER